MLIVLSWANRLERDVDLVTHADGQKPSSVGSVETPHVGRRTRGRPAIGHPQYPDCGDGAECPSHDHYFRARIVTLYWFSALRLMSATIGRTREGRAFVALINLNAENQYKVTIRARK